MLSELTAAQNATIGWVFFLSSHVIARCNTIKSLRNEQMCFVEDRKRHTWVVCDSVVESPIM